MATGDILQLKIVGAAVPDDSGNSPLLDGAFAAVLIEGMGRRGIADPVFDPSSITIQVSDPGFDTAGAATTVNRTVKGTLPLNNTYPPTWTSLGSGAPVPAGTWCCNGALNVNLYYTAAGGARGATAPTHVAAPDTAGTSGSSVSDGGVVWQAWGQGTFPGYLERTSGGNVWVYFALDMPIFQGTTLVSASIAANAYRVGATNSNAASSIATLTNTSTLQYEIPCVNPVTLPHFLATGPFDFEVLANHSWGMNGQMVPCVKLFAWDAARTTSASVTVSSPSISNLVGLGNASSPSRRAGEIYRGTINPSGIPAGNAFVEVEVYPWLGTRSFKSRYDGDGADVIASTPYTDRQVRRNGSNLYIVATPGTSAASGGPTGTGTAISDGTVVWNYFGADDTTHNSANPPARHHFYNDPSSLYKVGHAHSNGTGTNAGTPVVSASYAASLASATAGNSYGSAQLAQAALVAYHNTAGGGLTTHNDAGGGTIWAMAGTHTGFTAATSMNTQTKGAVWTTFKADPAAAAGTVIFAVGGTATIRAPAKRLIFDGFKLTMASGDAAYIDANEPTAQGAQVVNELVVQNCDITAANTTNRAFTRFGSLWVRNNKFTGAFAWAAIGRSTPVDAMGNKVINSTSVATTNGLNNAPVLLANDMVGYDMLLSDPASTLNVRLMFQQNCDNYVGGGTSAGMVAMFSGLTYPAPTHGATLSGNLIEPFGALYGRALRLGADGSIGDVRNFGRFNNTVVGHRTNVGYDDQAATPIRSQWYAANNIDTTINSVSDGIAHAGSTKGVGRFQNYWVAFRVGHHDNIAYAGSQAVLGFSFNSAGLRAGNNSPYNTVNVVANQVAQFVSYQASNEGDLSVRAGGGDYHPASGAIAIGLVTQQSRKYALDGALRRSSGGAVGAFETLLVAGSADITLGSLTLSATGAITVSGSAGIALGALTVAAAGGVAVRGSAAITLGPLGLSATGLVGGGTITGMASIALGALSLVATGSVSVRGTAAIMLDSLASSGAGAVSLAASAAITLGPLTLDAQAILGLITLPTDLYQPITIAEAKAWLRVESNDDDTLIGILIDNFCDYAESTAGVICKARTDTLTFASFTPRLALLRNPIRDVTAVAYTDDSGAAQALADGEWLLATRNGIKTLLPAFGASWPYAAEDSVEVTADVGYESNAETPGRVREACLEYVYQSYKRDGTASLARVDQLLASYRASVA